MKINTLNWFRENFNDERLKSKWPELFDPSNTLRVRDEDIVNILKIFNDNTNTKRYMENNILNWFRNSFHNDFDEDGVHRVMSNESCFTEELEQELLEARRKDIINVLKILNDNYPISDGGPAWLESEEDFNRTADEIIELEKQYKKEESIPAADDNTPCVNWQGPNPKAWACRIFCMHPGSCDGINCKKNCDWYNKTGFYAEKKTSKRKK